MRLRYPDHAVVETAEEPRQRVLKRDLRRKTPEEILETEAGSVGEGF